MVGTEVDLGRLDASLQQVDRTIQNLSRNSDKLANSLQTAFGRTLNNATGAIDFIKSFKDAFSRIEAIAAGAGNSAAEAFNKELNKISSGIQKFGEDGVGLNMFVSEKDISSLRGRIGTLKAQIEELQNESKKLKDTFGVTLLEEEGYRPKKLNAKQERQRSRLESSINVFEQYNNGYQKIVDNYTKAKDELVRQEAELAKQEALLLDLEKHNAAILKGAQDYKQAEIEITEKKRELIKLNAQGLAFDTNGKYSKEAKSLLEQIEYLKQIKQINSDAYKAVVDYNKAIDATNKALERELRIKQQTLNTAFRDSISLGRNISSLEMKGSGMNQYDTQILSAYKAKLVEVESEIEALKSKYPDLYEKSKKAFDLEQLKALSRETDNAKNKISQLMNQRSNIAGNLRNINSKGDSKTATDIELEKIYREQLNLLKKDLDELKNKYPEVAREAQKAFSTKKLEQHQAALERMSRTMSFDDAMKYNPKSGSIEKDRQAIAALTKEKENLSRADANYSKKVEEIDKKIKELNKNLTKTTSTTQKANNLFSSMSKILSKITPMIGVAFGANMLGSFVKDLFKITGQFELQEKALSSIIGSQRQGANIFNEIKNLAIQSPFTMQQLTSYTKQLAAYRIETTKLVEKTKMLADISAGVGVDMQRLILAYGQVKSANYLRGQELRQYSEAGVNILGGLQEYYKDTQNIKYSLGEIFDMVSKRKVLFEDVDAVLKRMTSNGGIFYKMQEIQSETLQGQILKIKDAIQIAVSDIGKLNTGLLKFATSGVLFIVKNLSEIFNVLAPALAAAAVAAIVVAKANDRLSFSLKGLKVALTNVTTAFALNPIGAVLTALSAAIVIFIQRCQKLKSINEDITKMYDDYAKLGAELKKLDKEYENLSSFDARKQAIDELIQKAKEYNVILEKPVDINNTNVTEVYKNLLQDFLERINVIEDTQAAIKETTKTNYDEKLKRYSDKLKGLDTAMLLEKTIYDRLKHNSDLIEGNEYLKKRFEDYKKLRKDYEDDAEATAKRLGITVKELEEKILVESRTIWSSIKDSNRELQSATITIGKIDRIIDKVINSERKLDRSFKKFIKKNEGELFGGVNLKEGALKNLDEKDQKKVFENIVSALKSSGELGGEKARDEFSKKMGEYLGMPHQMIVDVIYRDSTEEPKLEEWQELSDKYLAKQGTFLKGAKYKTNITKRQYDALKEWCAHGRKQKLSKLEDVGWFEWYKEIFEETIDGETNYYGLNIENLDYEKLSLKSRVGESKSEFKKRFKEKIDEVSNDIKSLQDGQIQDWSPIFSQLGLYFNSKEEGIAQLTELETKLKSVFRNMFGLEEKNNNKTTRTSYANEFKDMIEFIRKLYTETDKLRKNFKANTEEADKWAGALDRVRESFKSKYAVMPKEFKEIFDKNIQDLGKLMENVNYEDEMTIVKALEQLKPLLNNPKFFKDKKEQDQLKRDLEDAIGEITLGVRIKLKEFEFEELKQEFDEMFNQYDFFNSLKDLGVSRSQIKDLFGIATTSLDEIYKELEGKRKYFTGKYAEKQYNEYLKKINNLYKSSINERIKTYTKYLEKEMSEAVKIQIETMRKVAEVRTLSGKFTESQIADIVNNLQDEMKENLDKLAWEDFQKSDIYIEIFNDLEHTSSIAIKKMLDKLEELKRSLSNLTPENVRAITGQMEQLSELLIKKNPFSMLNKSIKESIKLKKEMKEDGDLEEIVNKYVGDTSVISKQKKLDIAANNATEKKESLQKDIETLETAKKRYDDVKEYIQELNKKDVTTIGIDVELDLSKKTDAEIKDIEKKIKSEIGKKQGSIDTQTEYIRSLNKDYREKYETDRTEADKTKIESEQGNLIKLKAQKTALEEIYSLIIKIESANTDIDNIKTDNNGLDVENLDAKLKELKDDLTTTTKDADKLSTSSKKMKQWKKVLSEVATQAALLQGEMTSLYSSIMENLDYLGGETNDLTNAWKEFGEEIGNVITNSLNMIPSLVAGFTSAGISINSAMGIIGLIAEAIQLVITLISAISKIHDAKLDVQIDKLNDKVEKLKKNYDKLTDSIKSAMDLEYLKEYNAEAQSTIDLQIAAYEQMIKLEKSKKKTDSDVIKEYEESIDTLLETTEDRIKNFYDKVGGFGDLESMTNAAEEFASVWYDAFKESESGLVALEDKFDDYIENIIKKQIMLKLSDSIIKPVLEQVNDALADGDLTNAELVDILNASDQAFSEYNQRATEIANTFQNLGYGDSLDGLSASIQGMTEDTAELLASYMNSIRLYVSQIDYKFDLVVNGIVTNNANENPILAQLQLIAANTSAVYTLLDNLVSPNHPVGGGGGIRVFTD